MALSQSVTHSEPAPSPGDPPRTNSSSTPHSASIPAEVDEEAQVPAVQVAALDEGASIDHYEDLLRVVWV